MDILYNFIITITFSEKLYHLIGGAVKHFFFGVVKCTFGGITANLEFIILPMKCLRFILCCTFRNYLPELLHLLHLTIGHPFSPGKISVVQKLFGEALLSCFDQYITIQTTIHQY